ncbi:DUF433 domain-containing protein [Halomicronema sp. CCY15110]|uniref:DUF433 domain-containing protein n=1 Tax=Halomicronema sp. CCY15110 TaxID=2767773 RepID=UPI00194EB98F|nr:DUF433 domain-containing protein [Halomicronema sp. CCY15110]
MSTIARLDTRNLPAYSYQDAERYLHIPKGTIRSWVKGRTYETKQGKRFSEPLIELPKPDAKALSFTNLVEAHVLRAIRVEHEVRLDQIRIALSFISDELGYPHPLVREDFLKTDGQSIYVEHLERLLDASKGGQIAIRETLDIYLTRIEVDEQGIASRLFPFVHPDRAKDDPKVIVIDPDISFGRPVIVGTRIPTSVLADRYQAGESVDLLAEDYRCDLALIQTALEYEGLAA